MTRYANMEQLQRAIADGDVTLVTDGHRTDVVPKAATGKMSEHELQRRVIDACWMMAAMQPEFSLIMAIPNGQYRKGQRPEPGIVPGAFDLFLPVPSGQYHGLWIELKISPNKPSRAQLEFMRRMQQQGYSCVVAYDTVQAVIDAITEYLGEL